MECRAGREWHDGVPSRDGVARWSARVMCHDGVASQSASVNIEGDIIYTILFQQFLKTITSRQNLSGSNRQLATGDRQNISAGSGM